MTRQIALTDAARWLNAHPNATPWDWLDEALANPEGRLTFIRVVSAVVSFADDAPPEDGHGEYAGDDRYKQCRRDAGQLFQEAGMDGIVLVPHVYRIRDAWKPILRHVGYGPGGELGGYWQAVHDDVLRRGTWRSYVAHSAHVHGLAVAGQRGTPDADFRSGDEVGSEDVIVERFSGRSSAGDPETFREVFHAALYLLSHASPPEASPSAVTYAGDLAPNAGNRWTQLVDGDPDEDGTQAHQLTLAVDALMGEVLGDRGKDQEDTKGACRTCEARQWISIWQVPELLEQVEAEDRELTHEESLRVALALTRFGVLKAERLAVSYGFIREEDRGSIDVEDPCDVRRLFGLEEEEEDRDRPPPPWRRLMAKRTGDQGAGTTRARAPTRPSSSSRRSAPGSWASASPRPASRP